MRCLLNIWIDNVTFPNNRKTRRYASNDCVHYQSSLRRNIMHPFFLPLIFRLIIGVPMIISACLVFPLRLKVYAKRVPYSKLLVMTLASFTSTIYLSISFISLRVNLLWHSLAMVVLITDIVISLNWLRTNPDLLNSLRERLMPKLRLFLQ